MIKLLEKLMAEDFEDVFQPMQGNAIIGRFDSLFSSLKKKYFKSAIKLGVQLGIHTLSMEVKKEFKSYFEKWFSEKKIITILDRLYELDKSDKLGILHPNLIEHTDFLILLKQIDVLFPYSSEIQEWLDDKRDTFKGIRFKYDRVVEEGELP